MSLLKPAFRFNSGRLSLDFACTVRHRASKNLELLEEPSDLSRWLLEAKVAAQLTSVTPAQLDDAKRLRQAIFENASRISEAKAPDRKSIAVINEFAALPLAKVQLDFLRGRSISPML